MTAGVPDIGGECLPVIDLMDFLRSGSDPAALDACRQVAACLRDTGAAIVRDPRVNEADNSRFVDMMVRA